MVQYAGHHEPDDEILWRTENGGTRWTACWVRAGQLTAVLTVDKPREASDARRLLAAGAAVDVSRLPDPSVRLTDCRIG
jgi:hypothetical protein